MYKRTMKSYFSNLFVNEYSDFDAQKNPFKDWGDLDWGTRPSRNNYRRYTEYTDSADVKKDVRTIAYSYSYNSEGYPIIRTSSRNQTQTYTYVNCD